MVNNGHVGKGVDGSDLPEEERPYYDTDSEKAEQEKVPVEYLGYLQKKKTSRHGWIVFWFLFIVIVFGFGPGTNGRHYSPKTGEWRVHYTYAWGYLDYYGQPKPTGFSEWYESKHPEITKLRWVPYGTTYPALFGILNWPSGKNLGWKMPQNLVRRMEKLDGMFRPGYILEIPRTLYAVSTPEEWNAIVIPLTLGTPQEAFDWWDEHRTELMQWAREEWGTPIPATYVEEADAYILRMQTPDGNHIPLTDN